jgi:hypothetical protein
MRKVKKFLESPVLIKEGIEPEKIELCRVEAL